VPRRKEGRPGFFAAAALNDTRKKTDEGKRGISTVILAKRATRADGRISTAERKRRRFRFFVAASDKNKDRRAISTTGTGFGDERELRGNRPCVTS
jgi:hypothetical protein